MGEMETLVKRGTLAKRHMHTGAIAGTAVGVVVVAALLAFCLYPVIVNRIKRRRQASRPPLDTEAGVVPGPHDPPSDDVGPAAHRLSSSDSLKQTGEASRGDIAGAQSKELDWGERSGSLEDDGAYDGRYDTAHDAGTAHHAPGEEAFPHDGQSQSPKIAQFPEYDGEYMPESIVEDTQPGVLTGTSADYYRTSIPSEAFGMVTKPERPVKRVDSGDSRSHSRGNSLRHNVRQLFRGSSDRERTMDSFASGSTKDDRSPPAEAGGTSLQPAITDKAAFDSPTELSPMTSRAQTAFAPQTPAPPPAPASPASPQSNAFNSAKFSPFATERASIKSSPPAGPPAPGTVNPMDIMAPSTESEMWYRTEHQLQASHDDRSAVPPSPEQPHTHLPPIPSSPLPNIDTQPLPVQHTQPTTLPASQDATASDDYPPNFELYMTNMQQQGFLEPTTMSQHARHPSYPSEQSTPLPGPSSTDPSSHNTPATQLDSPSPQSLGSSDFRNSASPRISVGAHSPKTGPFRCEAPGCTQFFDQPHKLKHHQRYHSKDHKCPYAGCGKGFGTKTHLDRHINDRHEKKKKFHCAVQGCDYSRAGGRAFPRKDNWKRHMTRIHRMDQNHLPDPVEVDQEMGGT